MSDKIDLVNQRFGSLIVIQYDKSDSKHSKWVCRCDCGNVKNIRSDYLRKGITRSCGCLQYTDRTRRIGKRTNVTRNTNISIKRKLKSVWSSMISRCDNPKNKAYKGYGERGIKVCAEWHDFQTFYNDTSNTYKCGLSLDRIDNNGNYEPNNCRWADRITQTNNTRRNHHITYNGEVMTLAEASRKFNISQYVIKARLKYGWNIEEALNKNVKKYKNRR